MGRPDASAERMVSVTKRYELSVVLVLSALLATLTIDYFFLPPKYTLRFDPVELPELLAFFVPADLSQFAVITDLEKKAK